MQKNISDEIIIIYLSLFVWNVNKNYDNVE